MAMNKEDMASAILEACGSVTTPQDAMTEFSNALKTYIEENCVITFSWAGVLTPPPPAVPIPDPVFSFTAKINFSSFILPNAQGSNATSARSYFGSQLVSLLATGIISPVDSAFIVACPPLLTNPVLTPPLMLLTPDASKDTPTTAMEHFCDQIIDVIKSMKNPIATTGTHTVPPPYVGTGTAVMTSIV